MVYTIPNMMLHHAGRSNHVFVGAAHRYRRAEIWAVKKVRRQESMVEASSNYHTYVRGMYLRVPQKPPLRTLLAASKAYSNNFFEPNFTGTIR